ncbi:glycoside hydrolase family 15 protein [Streptacidiphilus sp. P02-A3a]|uniref:glycoside hydrolase family 15 protein n=1 Tax=Streptacidiphilus sp. P02-A3a TaxID=2704468 RepID=UPI0015FC7D7A|nr:glycoside hydrolase family 15 protein [Streptacidiphilus sp. P02-A3a]QMU69510.1 glycoside hydrolase family 15 protein [Streptacidiphilus sp. P02-A3a]
MDEYPPIADHGLVGDLQTAALVSTGGVLDWWCTPRFDSPSVFAALLDRERGGECLLAAAEPDATVHQIYLSDTAILVTRFLTPNGVGEVIDFMPVNDPHTADDRHTVLRAARVVRGTMRFTLGCRPRFDYGRAPHRLGARGGDAVFHGPHSDLYLQATAPIELRHDNNDPNHPDVTADFTLSAGQVAAVALTSCSAEGGPPAPFTVDAAHAAFDATRGYWHDWIRHCRYRGRWQQQVHRSAITLKLLTYAPTGAPIAAATMGLPEQVGGERNWDYRYTWIRDASLSVRALIDLGFTEEADAYRHWLSDRLRAGDTVSGEPLQIMYRVDGDPRLGEEVLDHLEGYRGSAPVRVGNGAADQLQLDIYGEAAYAIAQATDLAATTGHRAWQANADLLDWLADNWDRPDEGIWETRGGRQDFSYSRLMCWVAFDRGIRLATSYARPADLPRWTGARDAVMRQLLERGWSEKRQAFVQHYATDVLDASLLLMPLVGFISPKDPAWLSTLDAMDQELVSDSLVYRYNPAASPDGLRGSEGTFNLCSFLYVDALARAGRLDQARYAFDKMLTYANHVGLFAEEIGPTGEQLGNFPQAFTHLALISAAIALDEELDREEAP